MLGHDITAALPELRAHAESNLTDLCRIERKTGAVTIDTANGMETAEWVVAHEAVPCLILPPKMQPQTAEAGDQMLTVLRHVVAVPVAVEDIRVEDRLTVTQSGDGSLINATLYVTGVPRGSQMVLRRIDVTEVP